MEPYRPFVDATVRQLQKVTNPEERITKSQKSALLQVITLDCVCENERTTVGNAIRCTAASLSSCFKEKKPHLLIYPEFYE